MVGKVIRKRTDGFSSLLRSITLPALFAFDLVRLDFIQKGLKIGVTVPLVLFLGHFVPFCTDIDSFSVNEQYCCQDTSSRSIVG